MNVLQAFPISIAYLNTLQNIETFPETGHLFYLGLSEKSGNFGLSQGSMERIWKVVHTRFARQNLIVKIYKTILRDLERAKAISFSHHRSHTYAFRQAEITPRHSSTMQEIN